MDAEKMKPRVQFFGWQQDGHPARKTCKGIWCKLANPGLPRKMAIKMCMCVLCVCVLFVKIFVTVENFQCVCFSQKSVHVVRSACNLDHCHL